MSMTSTILSTEIDGWVVRYRTPGHVGVFPVSVLLHGFTGDEKSMWIFVSRVPADHLVISPRGLYPSPMGGFSWHPPSSRAWPKSEEFQSAIEALRKLLSPRYFPMGDFSRVTLIGFSQGAALAYLYALRFPEQVSRVIGLAGFLPEDASTLADGKPLTGVRVYIAHGNRDTVVPIQMARQAIDVLTQLGANVTYCEENIGHKLSAGCFRGLESFFKA